MLKDGEFHSNSNAEILVQFFDKDLIGPTPFHTLFTSIDILKYVF